MPEALRWGLDFDAIVTKVISADPDRVGINPGRRKQREGSAQRRTAIKTTGSPKP